MKRDELDALWSSLFEFRAMPYLSAEEKLKVQAVQALVTAALERPDPERVSIAGDGYDADEGEDADDF